MTSAEFSGKTVLVTGATRGIGAAIADEFGRLGAALIITGTGAEAPKDIGNAEYLTGDFSSEESLNAFLAELEKFDRIDVCVNNAGANRITPFDEAPRENLDELMRINLHAPYLICQTVARMMKKAGYGRIVNVSSIWSVATKKGRSVYTAAKSGMVGMTRSIAVEMAPFNIIANTLSPGFIMTDMTATTLTAEDRERLAAQVPLGRFGQPDEIAKAVVFLASERNTYLTGQNIVVDGGYTSV